MSEAKSCEYCNKVGLPILPIRYAYVNDICGMPQLNPSFLPNDLYPGFAQQGTTGRNLITGRLLRDGYLYTMARYPKYDLWTGYLVRDGFYMQLFNIKSTEFDNLEDKLNGYYSQINADGSFKPCKDLGHQCRASLITVPTTKDLEAVWLGFSDVQWTANTLLAHSKDIKNFSSTMRKLDVQAWLGDSSVERATKLAKDPYSVGPHVAHIDAVREVVAEYSHHLKDDLKRQYLRLSQQPLTGKDYVNSPEEFKLVHNNRYAERFIREQDGYDDFNYRLTPEAKITEIQWKRRDYEKTSTKTEVTKDGLEDYSDKPALELIAAAKKLSLTMDDTKDKNSASEGNYGVIVSLDDPVGILKYIRVLMIWKIGMFSVSRKDNRGWNVFSAHGLLSCKSMIQAQASTKLIEAEKAEIRAKRQAYRDIVYRGYSALKPTADAATDQAILFHAERNCDIIDDYEANYESQTKESTARLFRLLKITDEKLKNVGETAWNEYKDYCYEDKARQFLISFYEELKDHKAKKIEFFGENFVIMMNSATLLDYFNHNFDQKDLENGLDFSEIIENCLRNVSENSQACLNSLTDCIANWVATKGGNIDEDLLMRAMLFNDEKMINEVRNEQLQSGNASGASGGDTLNYLAFTAASASLHAYLEKNSEARPKALADLLCAIFQPIWKVCNLAKGSTGSDVFKNSFFKSFYKIKDLIASTISGPPGSNKLITIYTVNYTADEQEALKTSKRAALLLVVGGLFSIINIFDTYPENISVKDLASLEGAFFVGTIAETLGAIVEAIGKPLEVRNEALKRSTGIEKKLGEKVVKYGKRAGVVGAVLMMTGDLYGTVTAVGKGHKMLATAHAVSVGLGGLTIWVTLTIKAAAGPVGILVFAGVIGVQFWIAHLKEEAKIEDIKTWLEKSRFGTSSDGERPSMVAGSYNGAMVVSPGTYYEGNEPYGTHESQIMKWPYQSWEKEMAAFKDIMPKNE